jgi:hypothetical protein
MTTKAAEAEYEANHVRRHAGRKNVIFNPQNLPVEELPVIYGFNNSCSPGWMWMQAVLLAEDGTGLGAHTYSSEAYMPYDLGIIEGSRPDRHEVLQRHYPNGYKMEFVSHADVPDHEGLGRAILAYRLKAITDPPLET